MLQGSGSLSGAEERLEDGLVRTPRWLGTGEVGHHVEGGLDRLGVDDRAVRRRDGGHAVLLELPDCPSGCCPATSAPRRTATRIEDSVAMVLTKLGGATGEQAGLPTAVIGDLVADCNLGSVEPGGLEESRQGS